MRTTIPIPALSLLACLLLAAAPAASQQEPATNRTDSSPASVEPADAETAAAARREQFRRLRYGNLAELELAGKKLRISYPNLMADSDDYRAFEALEPGEVAAWTSARAVKLLTHTSLSFDGVVVPYGNASPDYPGVYSLWPKRTADGWTLVFNGDADIWGSQRNAGVDAVEVPLEHSTPDEPTEKLTIEFLEVAPVAKALPKEAAGEKALPKEAAGEKALPKEAAGEKALPKEAAGEKALPKEAAGEKALPKEAAGEKALPKEAAGEKALPKEAAGEKALPKEAAGEKALPKEAAGEKALPKEAAGEKALPKEAAGAKVLRIAWGDHQFLAAFNRTR